MRRGLALALLLLAPPLAASESEDGSPVSAALAYLAATQNDAGHFATEATYVLEALAATGRDARGWPSAERSAFAALREYGADDVSRYNARVRIAYAVAVAGYDPRDVDGADHVAAVRAGFTGAQFGSPAFINDDAWAILALRAAGVPASDPQIRSAVTVLEGAQRIDGGWSHMTAAPSASTDVTGMVLAALRAADEDMGAYARARDFLGATHIEGKGHSDAPGGGSNCQSTVWALHAYHALGVAPSAGSAAWLAGQQREDGGFAIGSGASNAFCTAEAIVAVSGARHPLPGHAPATVRTPPCHALEPATLSVAPPFSRLDVTWDDGDPSGATRVVPAAGEHAFRYHASGTGISARGADTLSCLSARPVIPAFAAEARLLRPAPLTLDLSAAHDPDGEIEAWAIDWGDGNVTNATTHAYAHPGTFDVTLRAQDDDGVWSLPMSLRVVVDNRAPTLSLPARIVADRIAGVSLAPQASDDDGDAVTLSWRFGNASGEGAPSFVPEALGEQMLTILARDPYGALANGSVVVEVLNTPPTVRLAVEGDDVVAHAEDADGPAPTVRWLVDDAPREPPIRIGAGTFRVVATAEDADGATSSAALTVERAEAPTTPPSPRAPPEALAFDAQLADDVLRVTFTLAPANATARVAWRSDVGQGEAAAMSPFERALPGATWATAILSVEDDGLETRAISGLLTPPARAPAPPPRAAPTPLVVAPVPVAPMPATVTPPLERAAQEDALEPASVILEGARRETPAAGAAFSLAALLALALSRSRRR